MTPAALLCHTGGQSGTRLVMSEIEEKRNVTRKQTARETCAVQL